MKIPQYVQSGSSQGLRKERLSGMELLRIIAMFLVLVVHADYLHLVLQPIRMSNRIQWHHLLGCSFSHSPSDVSICSYCCLGGLVYGQS